MSENIHKEKFFAAFSKLFPNKKEIEKAFSRISEYASMKNINFPEFYINRLDYINLYFAIIWIVKVSPAPIQR